VDKWIHGCFPGGLKAARYSSPSPLPSCIWDFIYPCLELIGWEDGAVDFGLKDGRTITVMRGMMSAQRDRFLSGIRDTFDHEIIQQI
jgi:hypothetical protein